MTPHAPGMEAEARALAAWLLHPQTRPAAVGVLGDWGGGKSRFLRMVLDEISRRDLEEPPLGTRPPKTHTVRFNAWHYQEANLAAALVDEIFGQLQASIQREPTIQQRKRAALTELLDRRARFEGAREALALAQTRAASARAALEAKESELARLQKRLTLADVGTLLATDPQVQATLEALAAEMGVNVAELQKGSTGMAAVLPALNAAFQEMFQKPDSGRRLALLGIVLLIPTALFALGYLYDGALLDLSQLVAIFGLIAWGSTRLRALVEGLQRGLALYQQKMTQVRAVMARVDAHRERARAELQARLGEAEAALTQVQEQDTREAAALASAQATWDELRRDTRYQRFVQAVAGNTAYEGQLSFLHVIHEDLVRLAGFFGSDPDEDEPPPVARVILVIDDLGRCTPDQVARVLEVVNLLLAFDLFMVVLAVDDRALQLALDRSSLGADPVRRQALLENLLLLTWRLPTLDAPEVMRVLTAWTEDGARGEALARPLDPLPDDALTPRPGELEVMGQLAPLLQHPRALSRFFGACRFLRPLAGQIEVNSASFWALDLLSALAAARPELWDETVSGLDQGAAEDPWTPGPALSALFDPPLSTRGPALVKGDLRAWRPLVRRLGLAPLV